MGRLRPEAGHCSVQVALPRADRLERRLALFSGSACVCVRRRGRGWHRGGRDTGLGSVGPRWGAHREGGQRRAAEGAGTGTRAPGTPDDPAARPPLWPGGGAGRVTGAVEIRKRGSSRGGQSGPAGPAWRRGRSRVAGLDAAGGRLERPRGGVELAAQARAERLCGAGGGARSSRAEASVPGAAVASLPVRQVRCAALGCRETWPARLPCRPRCHSRRAVERRCGQPRPVEDLGLATFRRLQDLYMPLRLQEAFHGDLAFSKHGFS